MPGAVPGCPDPLLGAVGRALALEAVPRDRPPLPLPLPAGSCQPTPRPGGFFPF